MRGFSVAGVGGDDGWRHGGESSAVALEEQPLLLGVAWTPAGRTPGGLASEDCGPALPPAALHVGAQIFVTDHVPASRRSTSISSRALVSLALARR